KKSSSESSDSKGTSKQEKPSLADLKKQISGSQPKTSNGGYSPTADPDGEEVVDRVLQNVTYSNGLVSGSKMGNSSDGRVVDWNAKNKAPEFPQAAKSSGKHGKLKIKLKVDKMGNVLSFVIVEGSGVPEIDAAVERVVGTWRVKLMKNGKPVNGTFYLNYNFDFK
ncbi:MAG: energy transducer TonB, partial [Fusobacterium periodonticum]|nr:energy transducer TonB [Fusobacterium periodonticum]